MRYAIFRTFICYIPRIFQFHFIFELRSIFMVMINIVKIELTGNFLLNVSSVRFFFYRENYSLSIPFSFGQDQMLKYNIGIYIVTF